MGASGGERFIRPGCPMPGLPDSLLLGQENGYVLGEGADRPEWALGLGQSVLVHKTDGGIEFFFDTLLD